MGQNEKSHVSYTNNLTDKFKCLPLARNGPDSP